MNEGAPTKHWQERCRERGVGVDPDVLWATIRQAIRDGREDFVRFKGRVKNNRALYVFKTVAGVFGVIVATETMRPVTLVKAGGYLARRKPSRRKRRKEIRE